MSSQQRASLLQMAGTPRSGREISPLVEIDNQLFGILTRCMFEAGFRASRVEACWPAQTEALKHFDIQRLAAMTDEEVDALGATPGIIRNRAKLRAVVDNARVARALAAERGSFGTWLAELPGDPVVRGTALTSLFRMVGPWAAQAFFARAESEAELAFRPS